MLAVGPVPHDGQDKTFPGGFTMYAEKAPNARGVKRVLAGLGNVLDFESFLEQIGNFNTLLITGNYPSDWVTPDLVSACTGKFTVVIDTLPTKLAASADVLIPGATWIEKAGTFENVNNRLQAFERAIDPIDYGKSEAQIALDLMATCGE